jgi:Ca-activated chloride channel family protein
MKKRRLRTLVVIGALIVSTGIALALQHDRAVLRGHVSVGSAAVSPDSALRVSAKLVQDKILQGSEGVVTLALTLQSQAADAEQDQPENAVDLVVVLDRSGSMRGRKMEDAKQAVTGLLADLDADDRLALVSYADGVRQHAGLTAVTAANRQRLQATAAAMHPGGATNLGAGLQRGVQLLCDRDGVRRTGRLILISDGIANRGVTDPVALGRMAAVAVREEFSVSTAGVGLDFNERVMAALADHGGGSYTYLENPGHFAELFAGQCRQARTSVATGLEVRFPLDQGMRLIEASGYPIRHRRGEAVFYPGSLGAGQSRTLYLSLRLPSDTLGTRRLGNLQVVYSAWGVEQRVAVQQPLEVTCVIDPREVMASIDREGWTEQVLKNDFNRLKEAVASDIRFGRREEALRRIGDYKASRQQVNQQVDSQEVRTNLGRDLDVLCTTVNDTFSGTPAEVERKQRASAKALQYEGYRGSRGLHQSGLN